MGDLAYKPKFGDQFTSRYGEGVSFVSRPLSTVLRGYSRLVSRGPLQELSIKSGMGFLPAKHTLQATKFSLCCSNPNILEL